MRKILLYYWKDEQNFGDALAPFIVKSISNLEVVFSKRETRKNIDIFKEIINNIVKMRAISFKAIRSLFPYREKVLFSVGSILGRGSSKCIYWGSGFMKSNEVFGGGRVYAVRGIRSLNKLKEQGVSYCSSYGDPALLLPLIVKVNIKKKYKISIVPHRSEYEFYYEKFKDKYNIVNLKTNDILRVIDEITSSEYILSTSLHGIIVAHAYNIPAIWIKNGDIFTDGFKFYDYFSSVGIEEYSGILNFEKCLDELDSDDLISKINDYHDYLLPQRKNIQEIQYSLLKSFPFPILEKYKIFNKE